MALLRPSAVAMAACLALTLSACGDEPKPATPAPGPVTSTSTTTPAPPTTTSAAPTTPALDAVIAKIPPAARQQTQAGAEAFGRFFIEQVALSGVKADPTLLDGLFTSSCKTCANFRFSAEDYARQRRHHASPALDVLSSSANSFTESSKEIAVGVRQNVVDIVAHDGVRVGQTESGKGTFVAFLEFRGHWVVTKVQVEEY